VSYVESNDWVILNDELGRIIEEGNSFQATAVLNNENIQTVGSRFYYFLPMRL
jgi:hypothetical protein